MCFVRDLDEDKEVLKTCLIENKLNQEETNIYGLGAKHENRLLPANLTINEAHNETHTGTFKKQFLRVVESTMVDYRSWKSDIKDSRLQTNDYLKEQLGDAWMIPEDGRIPLSFSREVLEELPDAALKNAIRYISAFNGRMKRCHQLLFHIVDYDLVWVGTLYIDLVSRQDLEDTLCVYFLKLL